MQYVEVRDLVEQTYELDGTLNSQTAVLSSIGAVVDEFVAAHGADFAGAKVIYSAVRAVNESQLRQQAATAKALQDEHATLVAGFDLVGQEDPGHTLLELADLLLEYRNGGLQ